MHDCRLRGARPCHASTSAPALPKQNHPNSRCQLVRGTMRLGLTYMRRRRGTRAPCHRIASNVTPTAPSALYASHGGGPGGLTIIAILDLLGGAAQCMVAAGPMHGIQLPATDAYKWMALYAWGTVYMYGGLCKCFFLRGEASVQFGQGQRTREARKHISPTLTQCAPRP